MRWLVGLVVGGFSFGFLGRAGREGDWLGFLGAGF